MVRRTGGKIDMTPGRDVWYHDEIASVSADCKPEKMKAEDPLFILYTSGSTGKPKGVLHTTGGYLVYASITHQYVFDYHDGDIYWCTADVGWVTGHSYIVYGPLANGATTLMFEGVPNYPTNSRFWEVIDKHKVNIFYTAPTAIRALMGAGEGPVARTSRKSLQAAGLGRRADQPGSLGMVSPRGGRRPLPDRRHLVADRDRRHSHHAAARRHQAQARVGHAALLRLPAGAGRRQGHDPRRRHLGQSGDPRFMAGPDAHRLRRPRPLRADLFLHLQGHVLHRRRLPPRRGRLLLDHRPRRRRDQRLGPSSWHRRGRIGARRASQGLGGRRRRLSARHQGPGHLLLRDA